MKKLLLSVALGALLAACAPDAPQSAETGVDKAPATAAARTPAEDLHFRTLVLDTHLDTPAYFHNPDYTFSKRGNFDEDGTHVDLPRMNEGGLDGGFWVIFTPQGPLDEASYLAARNMAVLRQMSIRELAAKYSSDVALAFSTADAERIAAEGKKIVFQSMENAYPLGTDVSMLDTFYAGGLRMIAPVHFRNSQFADSATDVNPAYGGLSPLGEALVRRANELGVMLDGSHASDETVRDILALSTTPIILSHSGPKAVYDHPRNVPDDLLIAIAEDGGVIQINAYGSYLEALPASPERLAAIAELEAQFGRDTSAMDDATRDAYRAAYKALNKAFPPPRSTFEKFMEHLLYTLELVGPEHVGVGADWDGGGGVDGMKDIVDLPKVTARLIEAGYSEEDIANIWGGNVLRLMSEVEAARTADLGSPDVLN
ncbi:dipeptidase [Hyphomonas sp. WL0036]|uniref:dipeptidase n=1 Tax=Hyphomonas sediminis TaxID=2866160 RepID=UPI001C7FC859|nr:dipeptidase [Hyphomonas sediminis]MBY9067793.1 dipeptidase [Hyphomonas sediminis]